MAASALPAESLSILGSLWVLYVGTGKELESEERDF